MNARLRFILIGLTIALLEEFITQGVLKRNLLGWIIPTFIAFLPFLVLVRYVYGVLLKRVGEPRAVRGYFVLAGSIGLMIEWFVIGLSPWSTSGADPVMMLLFQLGMFSFWSTVALAPLLLLDRKGSVSGITKWYKRFLALGYALIYLATLSASREIQFAIGIGSVLLLFILLNLFHLRYIRLVGSFPRIAP